MRTLTIIGRRWFQRGPGNTYHTAEIVLDGKGFYTTPKEYGYGDQYIETAFKLLEVEQVVPARIRHENGSHEARWQWAERNGFTLHCTVSDVAREKDL